MRVLTLLLLTACSATGPTSGTIRTEAGLYTLDVQTDPEAPVAGEVVMTLSLFDDQGAATGASLDLIPVMPDMGHGVDPVEVIEIEDGVYEGSWTFTMPGFWEVAVEVDAEAGTDSTTLSYDVE